MYARYEMERTESSDPPAAASSDKTGSPPALVVRPTQRSTILGPAIPQVGEQNRKQRQIVVLFGCKEEGSRAQLDASRDGRRGRLSSPRLLPRAPLRLEHHTAARWRPDRGIQPDSLVGPSCLQQCDIAVSCELACQPVELTPRARGWTDLLLLLLPSLPS